MKTNTKGKMVACLTLGVVTWLVGAPVASAVVYDFKQGVNGYTGASSTYTEYQPAESQSNNYAARNQMLVYTPLDDDPPRKVALMLFDLSSISAPVSVSSVTMTIAVAGNVIRQPGFSLTYNLYPILRSGLNFGNSNGVPEDGAVSFNAAAYDPTSPIGWGTSNAGNYGPVAGQDYGLTSIGTFTLTDQNVSESFVTFNLSTSAVASWINNPSSNLGFVIVADAGGDQAVIYSQNENAFYRPLLSVDATAIPEPGMISLLGLGLLMVVILRKRAARLAA